MAADRITGLHGSNATGRAAPETQGVGSAQKAFDQQMKKAGTAHNTTTPSKTTPATTTPVKTAQAAKTSQPMTAKQGTTPQPPQAKTAPAPNVIPTLAKGATMPSAAAQSPKPVSGPAPTPKPPTTASSTSTSSATTPAAKVPAGQIPVPKAPTTNATGGPALITSKTSTAAPASSTRTAVKMPSSKPAPNTLARTLLTIPLQLTQDAITGKVDANEMTSLGLNTAIGAAQGKSDRVITSVLTNKFGATAGSAITKALPSVASGAGISAVTNGVTAIATDLNQVKEGKMSASKATADVVVSTSVGLAAGATGAAVGAAVGSVVPIAGTAVGAVIGFGVGFATNAAVGFIADKSGVADAAKAKLTTVMENTVEQPLQQAWKAASGGVDNVGALWNRAGASIQQKANEARAAFTG